MIHPRTIAILGLLLVVLPFFGLPSNWKMICIFIIGICLIYIGYTEFKKAEHDRLAKEEKTKTYSESLAQENHTQ